MILDKYISSRWRRDVKKRLTYANSCQLNEKSTHALRMSELSYIGYNLFDKVASYNEVIKFVKKKLSEVTWEAEQMIMAMNKVENVGKENHQEDPTNDGDLQICLVGDKRILDPPHVRTKRVTNKRIKCLLEKGKKKKVKGATTSQVPQASSMTHGNFNSIKSNIVFLSFIN